MKRLALVLLFAASLHAQDRPKIGVALSGGGARGAAHIGVLRVLEEMHVPVDYVAGTSMGAVVGGLYASGMSPDEIEKALAETDWNDALNDRTKYKELTFRRKEDETRYLTAFEAGLRGRHLTLPSGLQSAQKLRFLLQTNLAGVAHIHDFSQLPVPFKAVAADIETGEAVILDHGDLAEAIRASLSIPGVFSPMEIDGRLLVDGGIADNVPVDVVRAMGADIVIAVDVGGPLLKREQIGSLFSVTSQVLTILTRRNADEQLKQADIVLRPDVSQFGTMAFSETTTIAALGVAEAKAKQEMLSPLVVADEVPARRTEVAQAQPLEYVEIAGNERVDPRIVRARIRTKPGKTLDGEQLRRDVSRLYGLDDFQSVTFALQDRNGQHGMVLGLKEKPWGPTYLRFGLNLSDDLQGESSYSVLANITRTRMNALGGEWRTDFRFGHEPGVFSEFYQPLDFRGRFFVAPSVVFKRRKLSFFDQGRRVAVYDVQEHSGAIDLGMEFGAWGALRAGIVRGRADAGVESGALDLPRGNVGRGAVRASLVIIHTDSATVPHDGGMLLVEYYNAKKSLGDEADYSKVSVNGMFALPQGRMTWFAGGAAGTNLHTDLPAYDDFRLGGLLQLGGFATGQLHGDRFGLVRLGGHYRIRNLPSTIGTGLYAGVALETGNAWLPGQQATLDDLHRSVTLLLAADTIVGPVMFAHARAETGDSRFYLTIGKTF
jgi:NTE family protein